MKKRILPFVIAGCTSLASFGQAEYCNKVIGGYVVDWVDVNTNYNQLTHAYFAFIGSDNNGNLCTYENSGGTTVTAGKFEDRPEILAKWNAFLASCEKAKTKKIISIGGYGCDNFMNAMASNTTATANFVKNLMDFVDKYQLDGVDLDWEDVAPEHTSNYRKVYNALRAATTTKSKLLVATVVMGWRAPNFPHAEIASADLVQIMSYDQRGGTWSGDDPGNHSTLKDAQDGVAKWNGYGIVKSKLVVGLPFYGYQQKNTGGMNTANWTYRAYVAAYPAQYDNDNYKITSTETIGLNGPTTIKAKTSYAYGDVKGVMVWEMSQDLPYTDSKSLHLAIITKMKELCPSGHGNTTGVADVPAPSVANCYYSAIQNQVRVSIAKQGNVTVAIYNLLGQEVVSKSLGAVAAGEYGVTIDKSIIENGVYIVNVTVNQEQSNTKIYID